MADSLRSDLLAIDGIAAAELEGTEEAPLGVRVQLAAGADAESVGIEVERVLANHGMRSHRAEEDAAAEAASAPAPSNNSGPPPPPGASSGDAAVLPMRGLIPEYTAPAPAAAAPELDSVSVEESRQGIAIRVSAGGESATRQVGSSPDGMDAAIVAALSELLGIEAELTAAQRGDAGGSRIITVLLEVAGRGQRVGSAVAAAGDAYAVAQAAWKALTAPE